MQELKTLFLGLASWVRRSVYYRRHLNKRPLCKTRHDLGNTGDLQKITRRCHSGPTASGALAAQGMQAAGLTFLTQEVLAGAVNPEQSEQTGEVENAFPAIPVQQERSCTADHQRPARESTFGFTVLAKSVWTARINGRCSLGRMLRVTKCTSKSHQSLRVQALPACPVTPWLCNLPCSLRGISGSSAGQEKPLRDLTLPCPMLKHARRGKKMRLLVCRKYLRECINQQKK